MAAQVREAAVFDRSRQPTVYKDGTKAQINGDFRTNETTAIANWPHLGACNYTLIFFSNLQLEMDGVTNNPQLSNHLIHHHS